jgi:hypothetical protein
MKADDGQRPSSVRIGIHRPPAPRSSGCWEKPPGLLRNAEMMSRIPAGACLSLPQPRWGEQWERRRLAGETPALPGHVLKSMARIS